MMTIKSIFQKIEKLKVLVIGDVMTDAYLWGKVDRISPEAPVPIVAVSKKERRLGGAANVALNVQALGAMPLLCGVVGNDAEGDEFIAIMKKQKLNTGGIVKINNRKTTVKTRVIGNNHHLMRIDEEVISALNTNQSDIFIEAIRQMINKHKPNVIIFEDYDKGALNARIINEITETALKLKIKTAVDPKKNNFHYYRNVSLFKPNLSELKAGLKTDIERIDLPTLCKAVEKFRVGQQIDMLMVTLSEHGVFFCSKKEALLIPAHVRNISDVSGAGDTVISVAACCMAAGAAHQDVAAIANLAGGLVCESVGVVPVDKNTLIEELLKLNSVH